jgi:hypothetical protein
MNPHPATPDEALANALECAREAHGCATGNQPYRAATWAAVADSWSKIAAMMPEVEDVPVDQAEVAKPEQFVKYPMAVTDDERETIIALRNGTLKVILNT